MKRVVGMEQYYTAPEVAARCVRYASELLDFDRFAHLIEPSAGDGAFLHLLPEEKRLGIDLAPRAPSVVAANFLTWTPPLFSGPLLVIGNPPFGQRAAQAFAFLHKACAISDAVAFILPRSFNKYTFQNRVDTNFHLAGSFDCEDFVGGGGERQTVRTVFQVWRRGDHARDEITLPSTHPDFDMKHCHLSRVSPADLATLQERYEFTIAQVGASFAPRDACDVTRGSHWFIRPTVPGVRERFERLDFSFLDGMNTAHKSLSKKDIVSAYEQTLAPPGAAPTLDRSTLARISSASSTLAPESASHRSISDRSA